MLHDIVLKGSTDRSVTVRIIDSTDGTPETGVVFNTAGIDLWYRREGAARTAITEATLAALTTAHADGGFLHVSDGVYRLDLPDAAFASGANYVDFGGTVTGMIVIGGRVRLVDVNIEDTVRAGLTALPNAVAAASGGLFTRGTGAGQINQDANGRIDVNVAAISTDTTAADNCELMFDGTGYAGGTAKLGVDVVQISGDTTAANNAESFFDGTGYAGTNNVIPTVTAVTTVNGLAANVITAAATAADFTTEIQSGLATAAALATVDANVDAILVDTGTTLPATLATIDGEVGDILTDTGTTLPATLATLATAANLATVAGYLDTEIAAILADTNELQTDWANGGRLDNILDARASQASVDTVDTVVDAILVDTGTTLDAAIATVDTVVDAIKAKTDSLTFTQAGHVDANVQRINDVTITGDGQTGTEFGV